MKLGVDVPPPFSVPRVVGDARARARHRHARAARRDRVEPWRRGITQDVRQHWRAEQHLAGVSYGASVHRRAACGRGARQHTLRAEARARRVEPDLDAVEAEGEAKVDVHVSRAANVEDVVELKGATATVYSTLCKDELYFFRL